ncbi:GNAT family N-acetyltransferase [Sporolactobacillus shoreae]|uniref:GNAT family N-acetyltransferase n=1 Tax=Sporolactobacillus shoreae TaxID=1465501 RepID=A0A4Z0GP38_9BACL|nr:GNAT family N-acetyltransferase [Sporolactobacillus shoreae]TGA98950.1 GNAT family N-acetyltransferase [Sporolactobacillus shoreae]
MNTEIVVKEYHGVYQPQVMDLILQIQQDEYHIPISRSDQPDLLDIENFYQKNKGNFWVALHHDQVVGTVALLDIENNQAALRKMFVAKDYRGKIFKTAAFLLNTAIDWARKRKIQGIYLGTTLQFKAAHRFYEKNGFQSILLEDLPPKFPVMKVDKKFYKYTVQK